MISDLENPITPETSPDVPAPVEAPTEVAPPPPASYWRLAKYSLGVMAVVVIAQVFFSGIAAGIGLIATGLSSSIQTGRYREIWKFESMPSNDRPTQDWFQKAGRSPSITRDGKRLMIEYDRPDSGPLRPPWEELGYRAASLDSVEKIGESGPAAPFHLDGLPKTLLIYGALLGTLLAAWIFIRREREHWTSWRGPHQRSWTKSVAQGAATALILTGFTGVVAWMLDRAGFKVPQQPMFSGLELRELIWLAPGIIILAPLGEEMLFRGALFGRFWRENKIAAGAIVSSLCFAALHGGGWLFPVFFVFGLTCCWIYRKNGDLLAPVSAHAIFNLISCAALAARKM